MNIALVTGVTGMLGSYIAGQLDRDGWCVRGLVRDPERALWLADSGVELVHGDVLDAGALERAAEGCTAVFHSAAVIGPSGANAAGRRVNVEGTANVATAATRARARLVHVSSTSVYSHATRFRSPPTDEAVTFGPLADDDWYGRSKLDAERVVLDATARGELWATIIRPPIMYGIRDRQFASRLAPALQRGIMPLASGGRSLMTIVHASSVAQGAVLALGTDKANGRVYNLANDTPVTVADFMRLAAAGLGVHVHMPSVPFAVARAATVALAGALTLGGRGNLAPHALGLIDILARDNPFSSARARAELGWNPMVDPSVAIPEAFRWWRDHHKRRCGFRKLWPHDFRKIWPLEGLRQPAVGQTSGAGAARRRQDATADRDRDGDPAAHREADRAGADDHGARGRGERAGARRRPAKRGRGVSRTDRRRARG